MSFEPRDYLRHILVEVEYLLNQSQTLTYESFAADETLRRAFVRSLEIIGEAVKNLPDELRASHSGVEWRPIAQMRDRQTRHTAPLTRRVRRRVTESMLDQE